MYRQKLYKIKNLSIISIFVAIYFTNSLVVVYASRVAGEASKRSRHQGSVKSFVRDKLAGERARLTDNKFPIPVSQPRRVFPVSLFRGGEIQKGDFAIGERVLLLVYRENLKKLNGKRNT